MTQTPATMQPNGFAGPVREDRPPPRAPALLAGFVLLYFVLITGPVAAVLYYQAQAGHGGKFLISLADNFAISGFMILLLQFVLASRARWMESPFGMDIILRLHRVMGTLAAVLLLLHPVLLAWGREKWALLYQPLLPWPLEVGRLALLCLVATAVMALFRVSLRLEYQRWRRWHRALALTVIVLAFVHSLVLGVGSAGHPGDLWPLPLRVLWYAAVPVALIAFLHRTGSFPWARNRRYRVQAVRPEAPGVFTVLLTPDPPGHALRHFMPGQFHFLTLQPPGRAAEEHPFTICSAPDKTGVVASTIKASGDFTKEIGALTPGTPALIRGPFGRFSCQLHPGQKRLVFIAGGVGITPFMSMLRHMHGERGAADRPLSVLLIYANRQEGDILFRQELDALGHAGILRVIYVLSRPGDQWRQERGHIGVELLRRVTDGISDPAFYVCGPPAMMASATGALREIGVPRNRIFLEEFAF